VSAKKINKKPNLVTVDDLEKEMTIPDNRVPYNGFFLSHHYREMFELVESEEPTVSNYHRLYIYCLENSQSYMYLNFHNLLHGCRADEDFSFEKELEYYQEEKKKLDELFNEFAGRLEGQNNEILLFIKETFQNSKTGNSLSAKDKIQIIKKELNSNGYLLDDLTTIPSSSNLETKVIARYWKSFDNITPEMFLEYTNQKTGEHYSINSIMKWISNQKPVGKYKDKKI